MVFQGHLGTIWVDYTWMIATGAIACFAMAWGIGANDVANSFATSVGSRTLKLWQACIIAAIFEFAGSVGLGGEVAKTVAGSIARTSYFQQVPEIFMYGMLCALIIAATWIILATYFELAVSTTHSIVGAVLGFAFAYGGPDAVVWSDSIDDFPYKKGFVTIVMSWFISPIMSSLLAACIFILVRALVLRRKNSVLYAFIALPILAFCTVYINIFFVLFKGCKYELAWTAEKCAWVGCLIAMGAAIACIPLTLWLKARHARQYAEMDRQAALRDKEADLEGASSTPVHVRPSSARITPEPVPRPIAEGKEDEGKEGAPAEEAVPEKKKDGKVFAFLKKGLTADVYEDVGQDQFVNNMHSNMEAFDPRCEGVFQYLQVFSACSVSFAHGANDVANAVGPFTGMWYVYENYNIASEASMPRWILFLGAVGIVAGLGMYGYNIIKVLGVNLSALTPSRGFSAELATGLTISLASVFGIPVSTTQIIVGAEIGVGATENIKTGTNWKLFAKTFAGWIGTIIFSAIITAALFCYGIYSPSKTNSDAIYGYQLDIQNYTATMISQLNATNLAVNKTYPGRFDKALDSQLKGLNQNLTSLFNFKKYGLLNRYDLFDVRQNVSELFTANSVVTVGYVKSSTARNELNLVVSSTKTAAPGPPPPPPITP